MGPALEGGIGGGWGVLVEGADVLTGVAAEEAAGQVFGDVGRRELVGLGGPVRKAATAVEAVRCGKGAGGAGVKAGRAAAAVVGQGLVGLQRQVGDNLAQEEVRADGGVDEEGVSSDPADAGLGSVVFFGQGRGIDAAAEADGLGAGLGDALFE